jgi:hypothetical protein
MDSFSFGINYHRCVGGVSLARGAGTRDSVTRPNTFSVGVLLLRSHSDVRPVQSSSSCSSTSGCGQTSPSGNRPRREDFSRVFDDPFNPDDAWGASTTNNVRPFFNFSKHAGQWEDVNETTDGPHDESDFWFFNKTTSTQQTRYYYHEYNQHHYRSTKKDQSRFYSHGNSSYDERYYQRQKTGRPELCLAKQALQKAVDAIMTVGSGDLRQSSIELAETTIRREVRRAVCLCAYDVTVFARALGVLGSADEGTARKARRSIVMKFHPDKFARVLDTDSVEEKARKRLETLLGHSILQELSDLV